MSMTRRVKQWVKFTRTYQVCSCTWQDPFAAAKASKIIMMRPHKPINNLLNDCYCSDNVILAGNEHKKRVYLHHTENPGSARTLAWTRYNSLKDNLQRLHFLPDDKIPQKILKNISNHVRQSISELQRSNHWDKDTRRILSVNTDYLKTTSVRWISSDVGSPDQVTPKGRSAAVDIIHKFRIKQNFRNHGFHLCS